MWSASSVGVAMADASDTPVLTLTRWAHTEHGTLGRIGRWYTLEDRWLDNRHGVSAIPTGEYLCRLDRYHKGGYPAYEVTGVPGRSRILIHAGNTDADTEGCILIGRRLGVLSGRIAVLESRVALAEFMAEMGGRDFRLVIRDAA